MANLNIYINGASSAMGATGIATYGSGIGKIAFDPIAKLIYVNGVGYGLSNEQYDSLFGEGKDSFDSKITQIISDISDHNTEINNLQTDVAGLKTGVASLSTGVNTLGGLTGVVAGLTGAVAGLQTGVASLSTSVNTLGGLTGVVAGLTGTVAGLQTDVAGLQTNVASLSTSVNTLGGLTGVVAGLTGTVAGLRTDVNKKIESINGITGTNVNIGADKINYLEATETTGAISIKSKIDDIVISIDTLTNTDLSDVNTAIQEIKKELTSGDGAELASTLIDKLSTLLGGQTSWNINGGSKTNIADIISALESFATGAASTAETNANTYADTKATGALGSAVTYTNNQIQELDSTVSATGTYVSVQVVEEDGKLKGITIGENNIASASTLASVQTTANNALPNGDSGYNSAAALATGVKSDLIGASDDNAAANTINGAKAYAASQASQVISWEIIS